MLISDMFVIGNKLLLRRKHMGLSQAEVAEIAELSERTYADIERGNANMRLKTLLGICHALQITPDEILTENAAFTLSEQEIILKKLEAHSPQERKTALQLVSVYLDSLQ